MLWESICVNNGLAGLHTITYYITTLQSEKVYLAICSYCVGNLYTYLQFNIFLNDKTADTF